MILSELGLIADEEWHCTPALRPNVALDAFVVMPDHMHAVVIIERQAGDGVGQPQAVFHSPSQTVGAVVRGHKAAVTRRINDVRGEASSPLWLRNYYEHIVRDDADLDRIRQYIVNNPARWEERGRG
jgi:putative transposase